MRIICFFDLPTETLKQKRMYRYFRKTLISNGFEMLQYSVYVRTCPNRVFAKKFYKRITEKSPGEGHIRLLTVTEKQFEDMMLIIGEKAKQEEKIGANRMVIL
ncbi:CRISPR-associated protein Cas2 [Listeria fleischmannii 1991]|jgi:CRISPR-associated protein Cas2|uniref:CRISPR-associated endoribonuclease Cas2 n=5 Tax=Listeria fleischmannii TaxID=1069827 RepID=A0A2X3J8J3_9LIST|nr:CRISPR-associated endonuclease Cas2 [Listeria fleischmannii]KMT58810.1 CRISPR-associated protein Cas2 [Listeria fleischmannii 1991]SQC70530.1 CRISPR-associated endoribonuclease Cas2 [Listeria fleischmannii subsp. fleischmannii]STY34194.1 CRISPR-associated endoribonuclease Cas2 [Listeria fleischmannii subsp. coloradonensis]